MTYTYSIEISKYDSTSPFAVVCDQNVHGPIKGRYATKAMAQARVRTLINKEG